MKKFLNFFAATAVAVSSFTFSACGDDDDDDDELNPFPIVGTWQYDKDLSSIVFNEKKLDAESKNILGETVTFKEDGTFFTYEVNGVYTLNGEDLTVSYKRGDKQYTIAKGANIYNAISEAASAEEKAVMDLIESSEDLIAEVIVDNCNASIKGNQLVVKLTITQDIKLNEDKVDNVPNYYYNIVDSFKGQATQTLIFRKQ